MQKHYKNLYESYYSYFISKIVCTCNECSAYNDLADKYFPQFAANTASHWNDVIHYDIEC